MQAQIKTGQAKASDNKAGSKTAYKPHRMICEGGWPSLIGTNGPLRTPESRGLWGAAQL